MGAMGARAEALEQAARLCETMIQGGRAMSPEQAAATEALLAAAKAIRALHGVDLERPKVGPFSHHEGRRWGEIRRALVDVVGGFESRRRLDYEGAQRFLDAEAAALADRLEPVNDNLRQAMQNTVEAKVTETEVRLATYVLAQLDGLSDAEARARAYEEPVDMPPRRDTAAEHIVDLGSRLGVDPTCFKDERGETVSVELCKERLSAFVRDEETRETTAAVNKAMRRIAKATGGVAFLNGSDTDIDIVEHAVTTIVEQRDEAQNHLDEAALDVVNGLGPLHRCASIMGPPLAAIRNNVKTAVRAWTRDRERLADLDRRVRALGFDDEAVVQMEQLKERVKVLESELRETRERHARIVNAALEDNDTITTRASVAEARVGDVERALEKLRASIEGALQGILDKAARIAGDYDEVPTWAAFALAALNDIAKAAADVLADLGAAWKPKPLASGTARVVDGSETLASLAVAHAKNTDMLRRARRAAEELLEALKSEGT